MRVNKSSSRKPLNLHREKDVKIQLLKCPRGKIECQSQLSEINSIYKKSDDYQQNKEYQLSIQQLKSAFKKTYDLQESKCTQCASLFRTTIVNSLEKMHDDLQNISGSFFRGKRYRGSFVMAKSVLQDLKKEDR